MGNTQTTPQLSPLEQFGQTVQQQQSKSAQQTPPSQLSPLEQLGQTVAKQPKQDPQQAGSEMVSQGRDRFGNEIKIPKHDNAGSLVGPLAIPVAAAAIAGAAPLVGAGAGPALVDAAGEPIVQTTGSALKEFAENYPSLAKLAASLGTSVAGTGGTLGAWELYKHITGKK